jgi:hypothetical protein
VTCAALLQSPQKNQIHLDAQCDVITLVINSTDSLLYGSRPSNCMLYVYRERRKKRPASREQNFILNNTERDRKKGPPAANKARGNQSQHAECYDTQHT